MVPKRFVLNSCKSDAEMDNSDDTKKFDKNFVQVHIKNESYNASDNDSDSSDYSSFMTVKNNESEHFSSEVESEVKINIDSSISFSFHTESECKIDSFSSEEEEDSDNKSYTKKNIKFSTRKANYVKIDTISNDSFSSEAEEERDNVIDTKNNVKCSVGKQNNIKTKSLLLQKQRDGTIITKNNNGSLYDEEKVENNKSDNKSTDSFLSEEEIDKIILNNYKEKFLYGAERSTSNRDSVAFGEENDDDNVDANNYDYFISEEDNVGKTNTSNTTLIEEENVNKIQTRSSKRKIVNSNKGPCKKKLKELNNSAQAKSAENYSHNNNNNNNNEDDDDDVNKEENVSDFDDIFSNDGNDEDFKVENYISNSSNSDTDSENHRTIRRTKRKTCKTGSNNCKKSQPKIKTAVVKQNTNYVPIKKFKTNGQNFTFFCENIVIEGHNTINIQSIPDNDDDNDNDDDDDDDGDVDYDDVDSNSNGDITNVDDEISVKEFFDAQLSKPLRNEEISRSIINRISQFMQDNSTTKTHDQFLKFYKQQIDMLKAQFLKNEMYLKNDILSKDMLMILKNDSRYNSRKSKPIAHLRGDTFYFKGILFFKDLKGRNCPNSMDYDKRISEGEHFPMDFDLKARHIWSLKDKNNLVQGVKQQAIEYYEDLKRHKMQKNDLKILKMSNKLVDLLKMSDFKIDFIEISMHYLNYRHSPYASKAMWDMYMRPNVNHGEWSTEENKMLYDKAKELNFQDWRGISEALNTNRTDLTCFIQCVTNVEPKIKAQNTLKWTPEEDRKLLVLCDRHNMNGIIDWKTIVSCFPNRNKNMIFSRYYYSLRPNVSHKRFTQEEDLLLFAAINDHGVQISNIPRTLFPNRTLMQLATHHQNVLAYRDKMKPWSLEDDKKLLDFVDNHGTSAWMQCSKVLVNHSRISCRTRYLTIRRYLEKNPNIELEKIPRKNRCKKNDNLINSKNWKIKLKEFLSGESLTKEATEATEAKEEPLTDAEKATTSAAAATNLKNKTPKTKKIQRKRNLNSTTTNGNELSVEVVKVEENETGSTKKTRKRKIRGTKIKNLPKTAIVKAPSKKPGRKKLHTDYDENGRLKILRSSVPYFMRLRTNEYKFYNFFKYSYNFELGSDVPMEPKIGNNLLKYYVSALKFQPSTINRKTRRHKKIKRNERILQNEQMPEIPKYENVQKNEFPPECNRLYLESLRRLQTVPDNNLGPYAMATPSYSTMMGLRALSILSLQPKIQIKRETKILKGPNENDKQKSADDEEAAHMACIEKIKHPEIELFRERFRFLFYFTALLTELDPTTYNLDRFHNDNLLNILGMTDEIDEEDIKNEETENDIVSENQMDAVQYLLNNKKFKSRDWKLKNLTGIEKKRKIPKSLATATVTSSLSPSTSSCLFEIKSNESQNDVLIPQSTTSATQVHIHVDAIKIEEMENFDMQSVKLEENECAVDICKFEENSFSQFEEELNLLVDSSTVQVEEEAEYLPDYRQLEAVLENIINSK